MRNSTASDAVDRNISAIHQLRINSDDSRRLDQKVVDSVAAFVGSTASLYIHFLLYGLGLFIINTNSLSLTGSLEAIFLALFVLINQRRMNSITRKHSDLHLQMSLLTEHEVSRLAEICQAIARKIGVDPQSIKNLEDIKKDIHPDEILNRIANLESNAPTDLTSDQVQHPKKI